MDRFEVGIRDPRSGQMMNREWRKAELVRAVPWLKRMNARNNDVYVRPTGEHGLVLVDDLKPEQLARMKQDGFAPAAAIETSPGNYQAWVKLSNEPLPSEVRRDAARVLAKRYGGDPNSADSRHYGRLAGFTNQKPAYTHNGRQPYVLAHECPGKVAVAAPDEVERIKQGLDRLEARNEKQRRLEAIKGPLMSHYGGDPTREYQKQAKTILERFGASADLSRMDWMIATDMAKSGRWNQQDIEKSIRECSPNITSRKAGHVEDYARRTAEKAWNAPEVQKHLRERSRDKERDQGFSR